MPSAQWWLRLLFAALFATTLYAEEALSRDTGQTSAASLKQLTLEQLSQIDVTSPSKEPSPAFRSPVAIYVITSEDIRRSGVTTIPEALRLAPGVEVARIDGSQWSVGVRGFGTQLSRSVLVLIDGRSVYTPLFAGTYWDVQDYLLEDIDRIEVIRGPGGTIWGPNAVNGVINIITKSSKDTRGIFASTGGGNEEQGFADFRYGGGDDGLTYRVYAKGFTWGPEYHSDHDNFDDWRGAQGGFRMDWGSADRDSFTVQGDIYRQEEGEQVALGNYTPPSEVVAEGNAELTGGNLLARWTRKLDEGNDFQIQTYYDRTDRFEPNFGEVRDTFDFDFIEHTKVKSRQEFVFGAGAQVSQGYFKEVASGLVFDPANRTDYQVSGFFEDDITLVDRRLTLDAGSKVFRTNFTGIEFEPSVRLMWTPAERHAFWAAYTHAIRTPSQAEHDFYLSSYLGMSGQLPVFGRYDANPDFAPEQLNGYELGYRTLISKNLFIDVAAFWNHYHDLFSEDLAAPLAIATTLPFPSAAPPPTYALFTAQFENSLYGSTMGGEIAPEWRPASFWRLRGSYSYLNMDLARVAGAPPGSSPQSVEGSSPRHEAEVQSYLDVSKKLQLDLTYRYVSALPAQSVPGYSTGDARVAWRFHPHVEFSVVGRNLLQPRHVEYVADPGGPVAIIRSVYASLAWRK
ncbi:MAG: TonB-dependent receptor [Bryobacteraceae bacterium]|jgi:iron complex outermembrane receptor protein